ncbi:MAG: 3-demethylubiquinone-9 3-methyltransferase [Candidatus Saccharibacteria bacterium]|nr:3-demethylubiquinone-9 3-methyltransferase [Candidatus Saccharibacteria bacterium]
MQKISPFLWFDDEAEEAANFYVSIFKNSKINNVTRYDEAGAKVSGKPEGSVMVVGFELDGQKFAALNGGPDFKFTEATSFVVDCENQEEVDYFWEKLTADGGEEVQCGWLKDKYGLSWQVVPKNMDQLISSPKAMEAMLKMKKIDIKTLEQASDS